MGHVGEEPVIKRVGPGAHLASTGWFEWLNPSLTFDDDGSVIAGLIARPEHLNHNGTIAGPIFVALAEIAAGAALVAGASWVAHNFFVVDSIDLSLYNPARESIDAIVRFDNELPEAAPERLDSTIFVALPFAIASRATEVAKGSVRFAIRKRREAVLV